MRRNIVDTFWDLVEDVKSQSGHMDPMRNYNHPLNQYNHPLKLYNHPYKSYMHPLNRITSPILAIKRVEMIRDLLNQYILFDSSRNIKKQSSSAVSTLAAKVLNGYVPSIAEAKTLAASVLSQDETKGQNVV